MAARIRLKAKQILSFGEAHPAEAMGRASVISAVR